MAHYELPAISALFLAKFDQKVGYTIAWKRTVESLDLDGVEYQCLPSGLHSVQEDLVYFTKDQYAGISAFVQGDADEQHRNAAFAAVGVLLPQSSGRVARSSLYAEALRGLARDVVGTPENLDGLKSFWEQHGRANGASEPPSLALGKSLSPEGSKRRQIGSEATEVLQMENRIPSDHPALSMPALLVTFGPLIFPLQRAALLRKRILLLGTTPVQLACNIVYDLSVLSNISPSLQSKTKLSTGAQGPKPFFNVGIFDIPRLQGAKDGYLACTTDDILGEKKVLYDILVELPPSNVAPGAKRWPILRTSEGQVIRATQRDFRRYGSLRRELRRLQSGHTSGMHYRDGESAVQDDGDQTLLLQSVTSLRNDESDALQTAEADVVEPESWGSVAYRSFMWWAAAGELEAWEGEEVLTDQKLLQDMPLPRDVLKQRRSSNEVVDDDAQSESGTQLDAEEEARYVATILFTYFGRLTTLTLQTLASAKDNANEDNDQDEPVEISADEARRIGIDTWNPDDRAFVEQAMKLYYGREALINDDGVQLCGVRIC